MTRSSGSSAAHWLCSLWQGHWRPSELRCVQTGGDSRVSPRKGTGMSSAVSPKCHTCVLERQHISEGKTYTRILIATSLLKLLTFIVKLSQLFNFCAADNLKSRFSAQISSFTLSPIYFTFKHYMTAEPFDNSNTVQLTHPEHSVDRGIVMSEHWSRQEPNTSSVNNGASFASHRQGGDTFQAKEKFPFGMDCLGYVGCNMYSTKLLYNRRMGLARVMGCT